MALIDLKREGAVFVLTMRAGENRFNRRFLDDFNAALDEVERAEGPAALVTTGEDKFYSNGLDLDWLSGEGAPQFNAVVTDLIKLLGRLLAFPMATAAAMNGHSFAGGAMLALAHDYRVMRSDRGYFCLPEIDLRMPFAPGMMALIQARLTPAVLRDLLLSGKRLNAPDSLALGVVDATAAAGDVLATAIERIAPLAEKDRGTMRAIKRGMYYDALALMEHGAISRS